METSTEQANRTAAQKLVSASLLRLRMKAPFFATLSLFAQFIPTDKHPSAATDGKDIYYNPEFLQGLSLPQQDGLLLHEVLHAALLHTIRRGVRDAKLWNIAADIVVNGIIAQQPSFELPKDGLRDPNLEKMSVEEVYELLQQEVSQDKKNMRSLNNPDLLEKSLEPHASSSSQGQQFEPDCSGIALAADTALAGETDANSAISQNTKPTDALSSSQKSQLEAHWKQALQQATLIARTTSQGKVPTGIERELGQVSGPQLNWQTYLWRYLVQTPTDFQGFDRRFVHQGLYLETLQSESVQVYLCIDTSGSINPELLRLFMGEVQGILSAYPHLICNLYYADAEAYGPYAIDADRTVPSPKGGGGTSFVPFFEKVKNSRDQTDQGVCIYLTDGYGTFPTKLPTLPVLWVVSPGGLELEQFPFGEAVRLLSV